MDRIQLIFADSASYLQQLDQEEKQWMWSTLTRCSHSAIKINKQLKTSPSQKQMQLLHFLPEDGEMDLGDHLLELAKKLQSE